MFTGIVRPGEVVALEGTKLTVRSEAIANAAAGASVAINGVCLTVTARHGDACAFDLSEETLARSTLGALRAGERVNLERPVRAGDELGGHVVQGHVDGVGTIVAASPDGEGSRLRIRTPDGMARYVVEKGSITVDGVSLTVTGVSGDELEIALIPHTLEVTNLSDARPGRRVNLEVDVLAKYVEKLVGSGRRDT